MITTIIVYGLLYLVNPFQRFYLKLSGFIPYNIFMMKLYEGYMPFLTYRTYYRIMDGGNKTPLILLHGGPGSTHNYFELLDSLAMTGRKIISYDQLGCGLSYVEGHPELWKAETWMNELECLINYLKLDRFYLLGQSWGGMLAIQYSIEKKPQELNGIILSSTLPASSLWAHEQHRLISFMSQADQEAIAFAEENNIWNRPDYLATNERFMRGHCADIQPNDPDCLTRPKKSGEESYLYAWGPNEYNPTGTLKDFDYTDRLHEIKVPALICSGTNDLCTPFIAKTMYDRIPQARWELFDGCRHMCFAEDTEHYCSIVNEFIDSIENKEELQ